MAYKKSKSLNGDTVKYIARVKKGGAVIARADSEKELDELLAARNVPEEELEELGSVILDEKPKRKKKNKKK